MWVRFGLDARIVDAKNLLEEVEQTLNRGEHRPFLLIISLEGLRVRHDEADPESPFPRQKLAGIMAKIQSEEQTPVFDLIIVDEAHYLRNHQTASHQTAALFRDASKNLVLLSATPLQTSEENLFNLFRLLSPDQYDNRDTFLRLYEANSHVVRAASALIYRRQPALALGEIELALKDSQFMSDKTLLEAHEAFSDERTWTYEQLVAWGRRLEGLSLFNQLYSRSRKKEVFEKTKVRRANLVEQELSSYERSVYEEISEHLQNQYDARNMTATFALISRQRQLSSSFYAAIWAWRGQGADVIEVEDGHEIDSEPTTPHPMKEAVHGIDLQRLWEEDSKYQGFSQRVVALINLDPDEKIIVFSYFRATIEYLTERLRRKGVDAVALMGGMGDDKWNVIRSFEDPRGPKVLVSSEVGSEGIDLQFSHIIFNYDLPWNPMRLEQRIGRIDRIGQKSDFLEIYNVYRADTVEDNVVKKLYDRIEIFKSALGDIEEILGPVVDNISKILIRPDLTDEEKEEQVSQQQLALVNRKRQMEDLEAAAADLTRYREYILENVQESHRLHRWVGPPELYQLVRDFFELRYPQSQLQKSDVDLTLKIELSDEARHRYRDYHQKNRVVGSTGFFQSKVPVTCYFEPKIPAGPRRDGESVGVSHPFIRWIIEEYQKDRTGLHPTSALVLPLEEARVEVGHYAFLVQLWKFESLTARKEIRYFAVNLDSGNWLTPETAEDLVVSASLHGASWDRWRLTIEQSSLKKLSDKLLDASGSEFDQILSAAQDENNALCDRQLKYLGVGNDRRRNWLGEMIDRFGANGNRSILRLYQGQLRNLGSDSAKRRSEIEAKRDVKGTLSELALGLVQVRLEGSDV